MWVPLHSKAKTRLVAGGSSFADTCPECRRTARFDEVEVSRSFGVFFIDLIDDKERKYRCSACHELFDLRDDADTAAKNRAPAPPAMKSPAERTADRAASEAQRAAEAEHRRVQAEARANRIEDELADLKKRLGR